MCGIGGWTICALKTVNDIVKFVSRSLTWSWKSYRHRPVLGEHQVDDQGDLFVVQHEVDGEFSKAVLISEDAMRYANDGMDRDEPPLVRDVV